MLPVSSVLQPKLWNIKVRPRLVSHLSGIAQKDRDASRLLFNVNSEKEHLFFERDPYRIYLSTLSKSFARNCPTSHNTFQTLKSENNISEI